MERVKRVRTEEGKRGREGEGVCCEAMCMFYVWVERRGREGGGGKREGRREGEGEGRERVCVLRGGVLCER